MTYSVVIPTHNKREHIVRCVAAVDAQARGLPETGELIVVDDGSTDRTGEALLKLKAQGLPLHYVRIDGRGPAAARNEGIRHARGQIVVLLDDDAVPQPGWLQNILKLFETDPAVVAVEGGVRPVGDEFGLMGMSPINLEGGVYLTCNLAARREALIKVGGLDEAFRYPAFEDCELAARLKSLGTIAWAPDAEVHHPRRRWGFRRAIREIRFYECLFLFTLRYGYLGWPENTTRWPRSRVVWSATGALPLGRALKGLRAIPKTPLNALEYLLVSLSQGLAASVLIWPLVWRTRNGIPERRRYL